jgi:hypothetical protein
MVISSAFVSESFAIAYYGFDLSSYLLKNMTSASVVSLSAAAFSAPTIAI